MPLIERVREAAIRLGIPLTPARTGAATNAGWLIAERVLSGVIALTVTAAVARHLEPAGFGVLSFALSTVLLFATLWTLGLSSLVVRELVRRPEQEMELLGTVMALRIAGGLVALGGVVLLTAVLGSTDETRLAAIILMLGVLSLYTFDGIDFWLQAAVRSRYTVVARSGALVVASLLKLGLIAADAPVLAFVAATAIEYALAGVFLVLAYLRLGGRPTRWRVRGTVARGLLLASWPLILSGVANAINLRADQLMLGVLRGAEDVGTYAAAARLSEVWYFIPTAIAASAFPAMVRAHAGDRPTFDRWMARLYDLVVALALPIAIVVSFLAVPLAGWLFGPAYAATGPILAIHVWAGPFIFLGAVLSRWLIVEDRLRFSLVRHAAGAAVNVALNLVLIPPLGGVGAAIATLVSYATASLGACFLYPPTRGQGRAMVVALLLPVRLVASGAHRLAARTRTRPG